MAVALSSRPIARIGRIWADGNLLRGSSRDLKVDTQLRLYTGQDDQPLDSLMASAEAVGQCPAYRGMAYALFEDLQLAEYGNRIPSLTFELFERDEVVPVAEIFHLATAGAVDGKSTQNVRGYALAGATAQESLALLTDIFSLECHADGRELRIRDGQVGPYLPIPILPVQSENRTQFDRPRQNIEPSGRVAQAMTLRYYDHKRDFQISLQRGVRGASSRGEQVVELPAVLDAHVAKHLVEQRLSHAQSQRFTWTGDIAMSASRLFPADSFADFNGRLWRIEQIEHRFGTAHITARAAPELLTPQELPATSGRHVAAPDLTTGQTHLAVIELPLIGLNDPGKPVVGLFASGTGAGWRRAALSLDVAGSKLDIGPTAQPAIMGTTLGPLTPHPACLIDERSGISVQMLHSGMEIANRTGSPLDPDAPLFWLSGEFVRYGNCVDLGGGVYHFSRLLRGCYGYDDALAPHPAGARFVLLEPGSARLIEERTFASGDLVEAEAFGLGDSQPVTASAYMRALTITPPAPVHGEIWTTPDGGVAARWIRRSRIDNGWNDGVDQIMAEETETLSPPAFCRQQPHR